MRLPVYPIKGDERWELLSKVIDKLETRETKKALARNGITQVNKAIEILKIIILAMFFELEIYDEVKLRSVYNLIKI